MSHLVSLPDSHSSFQMEHLGKEGLLPSSSGVWLNIYPQGCSQLKGGLRLAGAHPGGRQGGSSLWPLHRLLSVLRTWCGASLRGSNLRESQKRLLFL